MKQIGILSDTHGYWDERYARYFADCDEIWHAGDIGDIAIIERLEEICTVRAVSGNIDHGAVKRRCPELLQFRCEEVPVLLTHIGGYPGKWSKGMKKLLAGSGTRLMVDGHSHILKVIYDRFRPAAYKPRCCRATRLAQTAHLGTSQNRRRGHARLRDNRIGENVGSRHAAPTVDRHAATKNVFGPAYQKS